MHGRKGSHQEPGADAGDDRQVYEDEQDKSALTLHEKHTLMHVSGDRMWVKWVFLQTR